MTGPSSRDDLGPSLPRARRPATTTRPPGFGSSAGPPSSAAGSQRRAGRHAVVAAALILSAVAAWRIVRTTIFPDTPPTVASLMTGAEAGKPVASEARPPGPDAAAVARARAILYSEPLAADAYAVLALADESAGRGEQAGQLMRLAADWWPRGLLPQTWLLARSLRHGEYGLALARVDMIARGRPSVLDDLTATLAPILPDPTAAEALADRLRAEPPWRTRFLDIAVRQWREPDSLIGLIDRLQARPPGLSAAELRPYLNKLVATGRIDRAYLAWLRSLSDKRRTDLTYLYNGHFQHSVSNMPFDWSTPTVPGATISIGGVGGDRIMTVGFRGGRVPLQPLQHYLVLASGTFRLTGRIRTDRLRAERGVRWRIACLENPDGALGTSEPLVGTTAWRDFTLDFTVPDVSCQAQSLGLEIYARTSAEQWASGLVSFSVLEIQPR